MRERLDAVERALAEDRRAFAVWRSRAAETQPLELSPQALNDLAETLLRLQRKIDPFRRLARRIRRKE